MSGISPFCMRFEQVMWYYYILEATNRPLLFLNPCLVILGASRNSLQTTSSAHIYSAKVMCGLENIRKNSCSHSIWTMTSMFLQICSAR
jgi:hypothetical protein